MKLGTYKHLAVKAADLAVSEKELEHSVLNMRRKNSVFTHVDDRPARNGDLVVLNYEGFVDGKPFAGGKATHHRLYLGSGKFIPGFEEQIVGRYTGETFDIPIHFPEDYANRELAGQDAVFTTTIVVMGTDEIPEFDDDFALDFSGFSTATELADSLKQTLLAKKEGAEQERIRGELLTQIIETSEIPVSDDILDELQDEVFDERMYQLEQQGISLEDYLKHSRLTMDDLMYQCRKQARRSYQETAVLHAIAMKERFQVSDEELAEAVYEIAFYDDLDPEELLETMDEEELTGIRLQILCDKAMDLVLDTADYI